MDDHETIEELNEAFESIEDLITGQPLAQVVGDTRTAGDPDRAPPPDPDPSRTAAKPLP